MNRLLNPTRITAVLPRLAPSLAKYAWLQAELQRRDISTDSGYQRRFAGFYRVRRGAPWREAYFRLLESSKATRLPFSTALRALFDATGRLEASFASKMVATIDPKQPVIDAVVLHNLRLRLPSHSDPNRFPKAVDVHRELCERYAAMLATTEGRAAVCQLRDAYPEATLTDVKALDLLIWQMREPL